MRSAFLIFVNVPPGLIGGLVSATLLTLVLLPTLYLVIEQKNDNPDGRRSPELDPPRREQASHKVDRGRIFSAALPHEKFNQAIGRGRPADSSRSQAAIILQAVQALCARPGLFR